MAGMRIVRRNDKTRKSCRRKRGRSVVADVAEVDQVILRVDSVELEVHANLCVFRKEKRERIVEMNWSVSHRANHSAT